MSGIGVYDRGRLDSEGSTYVTPAVYNLVMGLVLCWGFGVNWWMVTHLDPQLVDGIGPSLFLLGYFISCMAGVCLFNFSSNAFVSFIGYNLVVVPFGVVIHMTVRQYDPALVVDAVRVTGLVSGIMMALGTLFPRFFQSIAKALLVALLAVVVVELFEVLVLGIHHNILDWVVALIFCGYVGVDWGRANNIPKTLDNAVDSAAALYMDIINLFLRILSILGKKE